VFICCRFTRFPCSVLSSFIQRKITCSREDNLFERTTHEARQRRRASWIRARTTCQRVKVLYPTAHYILALETSKATELVRKVRAESLRGSSLLSFHFMVSSIRDLCTFSPQGSLWFQSVGSDCVLTVFDRIRLFCVAATPATSYFRLERYPIDKGPCLVFSYTAIFFILVETVLWNSKIWSFLWILWIHSLFF